MKPFLANIGFNRLARKPGKPGNPADLDEDGTDAAVVARRRGLEQDRRGAAYAALMALESGLQRRIDGAN